MDSWASEKFKNSGSQDAARKSTMKDLNNRLVGYIEKVQIVKNYYNFAIV
jgi:hypothetical protein